MVSYAQLWNMDLSKLRNAASAAGGLSSSLSWRGTQVSSAAQIPGGMWGGIDADAAGSLLSPQSAPLWDVSDALNSGQGILQGLASDLESAKERLADAHTAVAGTAAYISGDGTVVVPPDLEEEESERAEEAARAAQAIIAQAIADANASDEDASGALANTAPGDLLGAMNLRGVGDAIREYFDEHTTLKGPNFGFQYSDESEKTEFRRGFGTRRRDASEGPSQTPSGSWNWRLFEVGYGDKLKVGDSTSVSLAANGGVSGTVGKMNSIDASVGSSVTVEERVFSGKIGPISVDVNLGAQVGANAGMGADAGVENGQLVYGGGLKGSLGPGASLSGTVGIDLPDWGDGDTSDDGGGGGDSGSEPTPPPQDERNRFDPNNNRDRPDLFDPNNHRNLPGWFGPSVSST